MFLMPPRENMRTSVEWDITTVAVTKTMKLDLRDLFKMEITRLLKT